MNYWTENPKNIYVAAHRGWSDKYPENTMLAFRKALELGVDQLETDIRVTKDGELVLIHDPTLDRTTDSEGLVCEKTFAELQQIDAGVKMGFPGERIPKFTDLMELVKDHPTITLDLELKEYPTEGREALSYVILDRVIDIVEAYHFGDRIVFNSWDGKLNEHLFMKYGKKYRQHVYYPVRHLGTEMTIDPYSYAFCCCMFSPVKPCEVNIASAEECREMANRGVEPWAGACVKDHATVDAAIERGVTLITCNTPDIVLNRLRERGYHN